MRERNRSIIHLYVKINVKLKNDNNNEEKKYHDLLTIRKKIQL